MLKTQAVSRTHKRKKKDVLKNIFWSPDLFGKYMDHGDLSENSDDKVSGGSEDDDEEMFDDDETKFGDVDEEDDDVCACPMCVLSVLCECVCPVCDECVCPVCVSSPSSSPHPTHSGWSRVITTPTQWSPVDFDASTPPDPSLEPQPRHVAAEPSRKPRASRKCRAVTEPSRKSRAAAEPSRKPRAVGKPPQAVLIPFGFG